MTIRGTHLAAESTEWRLFLAAGVLFERVLQLVWNGDRCTFHGISIPRGKRVCGLPRVTFLVPTLRHSALARTRNRRALVPFCALPNPGFAPDALPLPCIGRGSGQMTIRGTHLAAESTEWRLFLAAGVLFERVLQLVWNGDRCTFHGISIPRGKRVCGLPRVTFLVPTLRHSALARTRNRRALVPFCALPNPGFAPDALPLPCIGRGSGQMTIRGTHLAAESTEWRLFLAAGVLFERVLQLVWNGDRCTFHGISIPRGKRVCGLPRVTFLVPTLRHSALARTRNRRALVPFCALPNPGFAPDALPLPCIGCGSGQMTIRGTHLAAESTEWRLIIETTQEQCNHECETFRRWSIESPDRNGA